MLISEPNTTYIHPKHISPKQKKTRRLPSQHHPENPKYQMAPREKMRKLGTNKSVTYPK
jgi:hypothetical protein